MARSIAEIYAANKAIVGTDSVLMDLLTSESEVAEFDQWLYDMAVAENALESLFDFHEEEVGDIIALQKPHSLQWYVTMAKAFQYGVSLPADSDVYAVLPPADPTVLIVANAAAVELTNLLRIKVAKLVGGSLGHLSAPELAAFTVYMGRIKDAGVRLQCTSGAADTFQPSMVIYYDPLVLNADGSRIDGSAATPVQDAVNAFLDSLPFNGVFILNKFIAAMQAVPGVEIAEVESVQAFYGATPPVVIALQYVPDAGYMALDAGWFTANVSYEAYSI